MQNIHSNHAQSFLFRVRVGVRLAVEVPERLGLLAEYDQRRPDTKGAPLMPPSCTKYVR